LGYGDLLLSQTDEQWEEYNAKWEEKQQLARDIAAEFYQSEIDALNEEYSAKLEEGLSALSDIAYGSGEEVVDKLIEGMKAKERDLMAQMDRLMAITGMPMSPDEAQAIYNSSFPATRTAPSAPDSNAALGALANVIGTLVPNSASGSMGDLTVIFSPSGVEFFRATLADFRQVQSENPIEVNDPF